jgi:hypothetical protein
LEELEPEDIQRIDDADTLRTCPATLKELVQEHPEFARVIRRDELVQEIQEYLAETPISKPILLYGQSMAGKTKVLHRLCEVLADEYVPLFVTVQGTPSRLDRFLRNLAFQMTTKFNSWANDNEPSLNLQVPDWQDFEGREKEVFDAHWDHLRDIAGRRPVVMFDEVESLLDQPKKELDEVFAFLNRFVRNPDNGYFILAGSEHILRSGDERFDSLVEGDRRWHVRYEEKIVASCFSAAKEHFDFESDVLECMMALCDGHPRVLEDAYEVMASLANRSLGEYKIKGDDIAPIVDNVVKRADGALMALWQRLLSNERDVVNLASQKPFIPFIHRPMEFLECYLRDLFKLAGSFGDPTIDYGSLREGVVGLEERELIKWKDRNEELFYFKLGILPVWRRQQHHSEI